MSNLTGRWTPLKYHAEQSRLIKSPVRFKLVPSGRRSGKTELAKRHTILTGYRAHKFCPWSDPRYFFAAPTREQAKAIYWDDLKAFIPLKDMAGKPRETELKIRLMNGTEFHVVGMDKPERIEGRPWDGGVLDEFANMKPQAWSNNVRPALADREGWCWLIGVPEGRNHYYDLIQKTNDASDGIWDVFSWKSADILSKAEIDSARNDLDRLTFLQEFEASFVTFVGRVYYSFDSNIHVHKLSYDPMAPLIFTFDFNISPGTAAILQEQKLPSGFRGTGIIGEIHIPINSTTPAVCDRLIEKWGSHKGDVYCYGDATGGSGGTAKVMGSDWDLIRNSLRPVFGERLKIKVSRSNPRERVRVNAVNSRLMSANGDIRLMVDPMCLNVIKDFEGVRVSPGGTGAIDKKIDVKLSHLSDGIGYYIHKVYPTVRGASVATVKGMY